VPKYMLIMRPTAEAELWAKDIPFEEIINQVGAFNESLINAGVLVAAEGLAPNDSVVVDHTGEKPVVTDGPYGEVHELFNGFYILEVSSREEAVEWALKMPLTQGSKTEIRRVTDESDFTDYEGNEFLEKEKQWRADAEGKA
jgi:hypothetical protein